MSHAAYVLGAWGVTLAAMAVYTASLRLRGQRLVRRVRDSTIDRAGTGEE